MTAVLRLKSILARLGLTQREAAAALCLSPAAFNLLANRGQWPKTADRAALKASILDFLRGRGARADDLAAAFRVAKQPKPKAAKKAATPKQEDSTMLRRQGLFPAAKRHFGLKSDPFDGDLRSREDVYLSEGLRYVREAMFDTAKHGGFLAVVGESGSGKSTLRRDLVARIREEDQPIIIAEPYVLGMEEQDKTGRTLQSLHIAEAILRAVAPQERVYGSPELRFKSMHQALRNSYSSGKRHCLIIEEAHGIPVPTLKHLKRFHELEVGFTRLMGIILIGQPELVGKLSESSHAVREVVQRCEVVEIKNLNGDLGDYLKFKLARSGVDMGKVLTEDGLEAIREKLAGGKSMTSQCFPLAVGNLLVAAMNMAAEVGAPLVTGDVVRQV